MSKPLSTTVTPMASIPIARERPKPAAPPAAGPLPLLRLGFRPFYLLASLYAALGIPIWLLQYAGLLPAPAAMPAMLWHAHEMVFGFMVAVVVGFLFTAARNWTGRPTPTGVPLAALACVWIAARVLAFTGPSLAAFAADALFLLAAAAALSRVLARGHPRNLFVLVVLGALLVCATVFHLGLLGRVPVSPQSTMEFAAFAVAMLASVIGGRVIPMFTANAVPGMRQFRSELLDQWALATTGAALLLYVGHASGPLTALASGVAALLQALRLAGWNGFAARRKPIVWILHVAYAWIPIALVLLAAAALGKVSSIAAVHALTTGAIGGLIIAMITRTALGHTGRPLHAGRIEQVAYVLVPVAAVLRIAPLVVPSLPYLPLVAAAGVCWSLAFALYFGKYLPILTAARPDGREG